MFRVRCVLMDNCFSEIQILNGICCWIMLRTLPQKEFSEDDSTIFSYIGPTFNLCSM